MIGVPKKSPHLASIFGRDPELAAYLEKLPDILIAARTLADVKWSKSTLGMLEAKSAIVQTIREEWLKLANFFPDGTFGEDPDAFFQQALEDRLRWHRVFMGKEGTIWPVILFNRLLEEELTMIANTVHALAGLGANAKELDGWHAAWQEAANLRINLI